MITTLMAALLLSQTPVAPVGSPESASWGPKKSMAYSAASPVEFKVDGPAAIVVSVFGETAAPANIEITRDGQAVSKNLQKLKPKKPLPKGYTAAVDIAVEVPAGSHSYVIKVGGAKAMVAVESHKKAPKGVATAAAETPLAGAAVAAAPAAATPAPAPAAAPAPAPARAPEVVKASAAPATAEALGGIPDSTEAVNNVAAGNLSKAVRIAVYDFELQGIDANIGTVVSDSVLSEVRKLSGVAAIGMDEIRDMLSHEANKQILGCEDSESCLAEIAGALGVDEIVTGKLAEAADGRVMTVRRIDQKRAKVAGVFEQRLKAGSGQEFLLSVGPAIEQLYPDRQLKEGAERGVAKEVALRLDPPPLPTWSFWTVAGAAVAAAGAGGVFGLLARNEEAAYQKDVEKATPTADNPTPTPADGADLVATGNRATRNATVANVLFISGGVLAIAAGVMYLFTDWDGYGEEKPVR